VTRRLRSADPAAAEALSGPGRAMRVFLPRPATRARPLAGVLLALAAFLGQACVVYQPVPAYAPAPPQPSTYDRAWNSALQAAQDSGIQLTSVDRASGLILGTRDGIAARISVVQQADGQTRVEFNLQGDLQRDPGLNERFQAFYNRYMGR